MCLAVLALHALPGIPVLIAANRDEFHARPTRRAAQWDDAPAIYAGRDGLAGGTWMGVTTSGPLCAGDQFPRARQAPGHGAVARRWLKISCAATGAAGPIPGGPARWPGLQRLQPDRGRLARGLVS